MQQKVSGSAEAPSHLPREGLIVHVPVCDGTQLRAHGSVSKNSLMSGLPAAHLVPPDFTLVSLYLFQTPVS